ncbi:hypothetical protein MVEN_02409900 [Mycena venus]|uniref:Uncharacterized protein n=1 Tax=Mycena venus TaxID=2733690 RepID=A0A8H6X2M7_9AGAR|nr:hypothetical protein MVEN_02409900 [Mycena venus]
MSHPAINFQAIFGGVGGQGGAGSVHQGGDWGFGESPTMNHYSTTEKTATIVSSRTGVGQKIFVDGYIITVPTLSVAELCQQYRLRDAIRELLQRESFETTGAILEAPEAMLEKVGFKQGQIAELKRALTEFLSMTMHVEPAHDE